MKILPIVFSTLVMATPLFASDPIDDISYYPSLIYSTVLRMTPPFETRYEFTFKSKSADLVSVFYDLHNDGQKTGKNRVVIHVKGREDYIVPVTQYGRLYKQLPRYLMLDSSGSVGISLQQCVEAYEKLLSDLRKRK